MEQEEGREEEGEGEGGEEEGRVGEGGEKGTVEVLERGVEGRGGWGEVGAGRMEEMMLFMSEGETP